MPRPDVASIDRPIPQRDMASIDRPAGYFRGRFSGSKIVSPTFFFLELIRKLFFLTEIY